MKRIIKIIVVNYESMWFNQTFDVIKTGSGYFTTDGSKIYFGEYEVKFI